MDNWKVITSKSGKHELGCPIGQILVRFPEDMEKVIIDHGIKDPVVSDWCSQKGIIYADK